MIDFLLTILIAINPEGDAYMVLGEYPSPEACGIALKDYTPEDGWSFHCWPKPVKHESPSKGAT